MNNSNLFKRLRALTRTMRKTSWYLSCGIVIRTRENSQCPLAFVGNLRTSDAISASRFAMKVGFTDDETSMIMCAAYCSLQNATVKKYRRILLRGAGLKP